MRISARGRCRRRHGWRVKGFTLVEVLVVLAVAGIVALASLAASRLSPVSQVEGEARRLATLLEMAHAEASASGRAIAWVPGQNGYAFLRSDADGKWAQPEADGPLRARSLPGGVALRGARFVLSARGLHAQAQAVVSGNGTAFMVRSGSLGQISVQRLHAD
jgi:general secretion pathway protein H